MNISKKEEIEDALGASLENWMEFSISNKNSVWGSTEWISVMGINNINFQENDIVILDSVKDKEVVFHIQREWKDIEREGKTMFLTFNKIIFIQRFVSITNIENIIVISDSTSDEVKGLLDA